MTQENVVSVATVYTRLATPSDIPQINGLIYKLAEFEQLSDECFATEEKLKSNLFNLPPMQVIYFVNPSMYGMYAIIDWVQSNSFLGLCYNAAVALRFVLFLLGKYTELSNKIRSCSAMCTTRLYITHYSDRYGHCG